ncbi:hypothetical protein ACLOJK_031227 [Asimina triloba]
MEHAIAGPVLPGKIVAGAALPDGTRLHYRCNGQIFFLSRPLCIYSCVTISIQVQNFAFNTKGRGLVHAGLLSLLLAIALLGIGVSTKLLSPGVVADKGLELLSATFVFSLLVSLVLYVAGCQSRDQGSSLKPHITGNFIHDWWYGIQLNPHFMGIDLKAEINHRPLSNYYDHGDIFAADLGNGNSRSMIP